MDNTEIKKVVICVVVYDRIGNFIKWLKLAKKIQNRYSDFEPAYGVEVRIIHHTDNPVLVDSWKKIAEKYPVTYLNRKNLGYDIGVLQSVCEINFREFEYDFDFIVWFTDDCFPTDINFLEEFGKPLKLSEKVGMTCFEISTQIRLHARTTGFCLRSETLAKISFPVPIVTTKQDCYAFEHGSHNLLLQIRKLGLEVVQLEGNNFYNPDSRRVKAYGLEKSLKNLYELLYRKEEPSALVFATAHNRYPQIISSVLCQKHQNVKVETWHNGKTDPYFKMVLDFYDNHSTVKFVEIEEIPGNHYGHPVKKKFLETLDASESEYILITNEDNYISPYFISKAVEVLERFPDKIGAYCNGMVHNYKPDQVSLTWRERKTLVANEGHIVDGYGLIPCKIERGYTDIGAILFRTEVAKSIPWDDTSHSADWTYIENIANAFGGKDKFVSFSGIHFVHN